VNYRHAYHAGNFADVLKHIVLVYALQRLRLKDAPFAVLDTHAGLARHDLTGDEATRSPEWKDGIGRLWSRSLPLQARDAIAPWLALQRSVNPDDRLTTYLGSPGIIAAHLRKQDRARLCEKHPKDAETLMGQLSDPVNVTVTAEDGYKRLKGFAPPPQKRGLVLIDPPFEHVDEMYFLAEAAREGLTRWPTGTFIFWRPLKDLWAAERFDVGLAEWLIADQGLPAEKVLRTDVWVRDIDTEGPLAGAGVVVVNPPYGLEEALLGALPFLAETFQRGHGYGWRLDGAITDGSLMNDEF
jgi:23S rRNA (adenine2030-N6)-methyltransferase